MSLLRWANPTCLGNISPGIAPPNSCLPAALRSLKMNCKIVLLGPHVGMMPMIERFFTTWPGSGPLCVKTWIDHVPLAAVSGTFGYLRHPVVQPIIISAVAGAGKTFLAVETHGRYPEAKLVRTGAFCRTICIIVFAFPLLAGTEGSAGKVWLWRFAQQSSCHDSSIQMLDEVLYQR